MVVTEIDVINKTVLLSVFLIGMILGGTISTIINSFMESRRLERERKRE